MKITLLAIVAAASLLAQVNGYAAKYRVTGAVDDILIHESSFGQCAVKVTGFSAPGNCGASWLSLDCAGDFHGKEIGRSMLESLQIAKATSSDVSLYFDDKKRHNGRCVVYQLILR
jgi:hypothetical protein